MPGSLFPPGLISVSDPSIPPGDPAIDMINGQPAVDFETASALTKVTEATNKVTSQGIGSFTSALSGGASLPSKVNGLDVLPKQTVHALPPVFSSMKVTLSSVTQGYDSAVVLDVMPSINETRPTNYKDFTPAQHPGAILKYDGTGLRSWTINAQLISRSSTEASKNLSIINTIRAWAMPFYGSGTAASLPNLLGAPPPILLLSAYGTQMIGPVKCVQTNYSFDWPIDVDWIQTDGSILDGKGGLEPNTQLEGDVVPFPVIMSITIQLSESWSPTEYAGFDITQYRLGNLPDAFGGSFTASPVTAPAVSLPAGGVSTSQPTSVIQSAINTAKGSIPPPFITPLNSL